MSEMLLLSNIQSFIKNHPDYKPEQIEFAAAMYVLSVNAMCATPNPSLVAAVQSAYEKHCAGNEQNAGQ